MSKSNRFRNQSNALLTRDLFLEPARRSNSIDNVLYSLSREDQGEVPSLYRLYVECNDPFELHFAEKYFDSYEHWQRIADAPWMREHVTAWRKELDLRIRSQALNTIIEEASSEDGKHRYAAAKHLLEKGAYFTSEDEIKKSVGRPTKDSIKRAAKELVNDQFSVEDDYERLGLKVIK